MVGSELLDVSVFIGWRAGHRAGSGGQHANISTDQRTLILHKIM